MKTTIDHQPAALAPPESAPPAPSAPPEDPRVARALEEYLAALEAGNRPGRQRFLARYPDIAGPLARCLDGLDFIQSAAPQLHASAASDAAAESVSAGLVSALP